MICISLIGIIFINKLNLFVFYRYEDVFRSLNYLEPFNKCIGINFVRCLLKSHAFLVLFDAAFLTQCLCILVKGSTTKPYLQLKC